MFHLTKWYFDTVTDDGTCLIGYAAVIRWKGLRIPYSACAQFPRDTHFRKTYRDSLPTQSHSLTWQSMGFHAEWRTPHPLPAVDLLESPDGFLRWTVAAANSPSVWTFPKAVISGVGYVERLETTIPPWQLEIHTLRWGRFANAEHSVVWIDWNDGQRQWLFVDGQRTSATAIDDDEITWEGGSLELRNKHVLFSDSLASAIQSAFLSWLIPSAYLRSRQRKFLALGRLSAEGRTGEGNVVCEIVSFCSH